MSRAHHVVQDRFGGVVLHQRHVLVGSRVKYDFRSVKLEELFHPLEIADIGDHLDDLLEVSP